MGPYGWKQDMSQIENELRMIFPLEESPKISEEFKKTIADFLKKAS